MLRKIEDTLEVIFVGLLTFLPLIFYAVQKITSVQVPGSEYGIAQLVFLFASMAGVITWREDRHLSLASFSGKLPPKIRGVTDSVVNAAIVFVLTMLFFNAVCQLLNPGQFNMSVWGVPVKIIFIFLPLCYILMLGMVASKKEKLISTIVGALIGILLSMGSVTGILYYLFGVENVPALYAIFNGWNFIASKCLVLFILFFIVLAFLGMPLFVVLAGVAFVLLSMNGGYTDQIPLETYRMFTDRNIAAIPLFTIAGYILAKCSAGQRYVELFKALFGWFRGGTVIAAVLVMTFFSTFSGVSGVTILALGSLLSVVLTGSGYEKERAEALITSSGAIGLLFPPSAAIIMYGTTNIFFLNGDVIALFKAALIPGIIMMIAMIVMGIVYDNQKDRVPFSLPAIGKAIVNSIPELLMPLFIIVFYFMGVFDLFETSAFAVFYAYLLSTVVRRDYNFKQSLDVIAESIPISGGVLFILGAASGISYYILDANIPVVVTDAITAMVTNKYVFLILMNIVLLIVGCLMDMFSAILIVSPLLLPITEYFGISPFHAGVIFLMNLSIGFLTPPVGMDLFISSYTFGKPLPKVIKGIVPFLLVQFVVLLLITYIPWFTSVLLG